jgi:hypothetical protein
MISPAMRISMAGRLRPLHRWPPLAPIGISLLATVLSTFAVIGISFVLLDLREQLVADVVALGRPVQAQVQHGAGLLQTQQAQTGKRT